MLSESTVKTALAAIETAQQAIGLYQHHAQVQLIDAANELTEYLKEVSDGNDDPGSG